MRRGAGNLKRLVSLRSKKHLESSRVSARRESLAEAVQAVGARRDGPQAGQAGNGCRAGAAAVGREMSLLQGL
jgi:hypothetical protein